MKVLLFGIIAVRVSVCVCHSKVSRTDEGEAQLLGVRCARLEVYIDFIQDHSKMLFITRRLDALLG